MIIFRVNIYTYIVGIGQLYFFYFLLRYAIIYLKNLSNLRVFASDSFALGCVFCWLFLPYFDCYLCIEYFEIFVKN